MLGNGREFNGHELAADYTRDNGRICRRERADEPPQQTDSLCIAHGVAVWKLPVARNANLKAWSDLQSRKDE